MPFSLGFLHSRHSTRAQDTADNDSDFQSGSEYSEGDLKYVGKKGGNDSEASYQEASGAPVEVRSPLGYSVGAVTIVFLNLSKMIGTGVFSTRKAHQRRRVDTT